MNAIKILKEALVKTGADPYDVVESTTLVGSKLEIRTSIIGVIELASILGVDLEDMAILLNIDWNTFEGDVFLLPGGCVVYKKEDWYIRSSESNPIGLVLYQRFEV